MKKRKGLFTYLVILICIIAGVFSICLAIMVLAPGTKLAGFAFGKINSPETVYGLVDEEGYMHDRVYFESRGIPVTEADRLTNLDVSQIIINGGAHNVQVRHLAQTTSNDITFTIRSMYSGIYKVKDNPNALDFSIKYDKDTKTISLDYLMPNGLNFNAYGEIVVNLPQHYEQLAASVDSGSLTGDHTSLQITTTTGSVNLGGSQPVGYDLKASAMQNVDVKTKKGSITLNQMFRPCGESLSLVSESGEISVQKTIKQKDMVVSINSGSGKVDFAEKEADLLVKELNIETKKADFKFNNISLFSNEKALNWNGSSGRLIAKNIDGSIFGGPECFRTNFDIDQVSGQFFLPNGDYCDVNIDKVDGKVEIRAKNSNITIKNCPSTIFITTSKGNINLDNCTNSQSIDAGNATVNLTKCSGSFNIKTNKGTINAEIIDLSGKDNKLVSERSKVNVKFSQNLAFNLTAQSARKNISLEIASISETAEKFEDKLINGGNPEKAISISARKDITLRNLEVA